MAARSFTELQFWRRARAWSKQIFGLTQRRLFAGDQRLCVQINDSSESVMANMAEGFGRATQQEFITFLGYAMGSLDETNSHLCAAYDRGYLSQDEFGSLWNEGIAIRKMTIGFIRSMILPRGGVRSQTKSPSWSNQVWEIYERLSGEPRPAMFAETIEPPKPKPDNKPPIE
jgi:four helix bundle protein